MSSSDDNDVSFVNLSGWQLENLSSPLAAESPQSGIKFIVEIRVNQKHQWVYDDVIAGLSVMDEILSPMKRQFFTLEACYLMGDNPHWYVYMMISQMRAVPLKHICEIIPDMVSYLNHALITNSMGIPRLILSMVFSVDITKIVPYEQDDEFGGEPNDNVDSNEDDDDFDDDDFDDEPVFYPKKAASKSSIDALKVMTITGNGGSDASLDSCCVCLEEFKVGMEVKCMPCNHLFHGNCITDWLEVRNFCPLCRHTMPSDQEEQTGSSSSTTDVPAGGNTGV